MASNYSDRLKLELMATVETLTVTPVPTSTVSVPSVKDDDKLPNVTKASASATAVPNAEVIFTPVTLTSNDASTVTEPIAKSN